MKIAIFSALDRDSRSGNWITASRWQKLLRSKGHHVSIVHNNDAAIQSFTDVFIGLHARRSSQALIQFRKRHPLGSTIVALTGTDIYRDLAPTRTQHPARAVRALNECDHIIALQPLMAKRLNRHWRSKSSTVMMDVLPQTKRRTRKNDSSLNVCVIGHMRHEKDPLRAAMAVRTLPAGVQIKVSQAGRALTESFEKRSILEQRRNENWEWIGSVPWKQAQRMMQTSDVLVNSSRYEGAPNVLFEAMSWQLPVIATKIDGHVGILGADYPAYFQVGDTKALKNLLMRCHDDKAFYQRLVARVKSLTQKYSPGTELKSLLSAIAFARHGQQLA